MSDTNKPAEASTFAATGACLCGKVTYKATVKQGTGACHCRMCRRWSGGPLMSAHTVGEVEFNNEDSITRYASSPWAERGFCKHCGSNLFYHLLPRPQLPGGEYIITAGSLDDQSNLEFDHEVYVDSAPGWYSFDGEDQRKRMTEADILAMFGPEA